MYVCMYVCIIVGYKSRGLVVQHHDLKHAIQWLRVQILVTALLGNNLGQVVHIHVPVSSSSITVTGTGTSLKAKEAMAGCRTGVVYRLLFTAPGTSPMPAQDNGNGDEHSTLAFRSYTDQYAVYLPLPLMHRALLSM